MTRELKLSLIIGFSLVLLVAVLISDHLGRGERIVLANAPDELPTGVIPAMHALMRTDSQDAPSSRFTESPLIQTPTDPLDADRGHDFAGHTPIHSPDRRSGAPSQTQTTSRPIESAPAPIVISQDRPRNGSDASVQGLVTPPIQPRQETMSETPIQTAWYTVGQGETLFGIAAKHLGSGHRWREIAAINADRVGADGSVRAGVRIRVPVSPSSKPSPAPSPTRMAETPKRQGAEVRYTSYVVVKDDTLGRIAQAKLGTVRRLDELRAINQDVLKGKDVIRPGMVLRLPEG